MHLNCSSLAVEIVVKRGIAFLQAKFGKVLLRDAYLYWLNLVSLAKTFSTPFARFVRRAMSGLIAFTVGCAALACGYEDINAFGVIRICCDLCQRTFFRSGTSNYFFARTLVNIIIFCNFIK